MQDVRDDGAMTRTGTGPLSRSELKEWYAVPGGSADTWVRASFITSIDGRATGPDGVSGGLNEGSAGDKAVFEHLRDWADVVVVGAGTIREEGYGPLPGKALAIVSRSGNLPDKVRETGPGDGEVVLIGGHGEEVTPQQVMAALRQRGWRHVVLEGGPRLFSAWVEEGLLDELCVTIRPVLVGGDGPLLLPTTTRLAALTGAASHVLVWDGDLLVRSRLS